MILHLKKTDKLNVYDLKLTGSGQYRSIEFDFYNATDYRSYRFASANPDGMLYYQYNGQGKFGWYSFNIDKINDSSDVIINQNDTMINQNHQIIDKQEQTNNKLDQAEVTRKGIWESIKELPSKFLNMLKGLFIPDNFDFLDDFKNTLETKLGFIAEVPISLLDFISGLLTTNWSEFNSISFPAIEIFGVNFWGSQEVSLQEAIDIFSPYKYITDVICVVICVNTLKRWYENFAGGGNS